MREIKFRVWWEVLKIYTYPKIAFIDRNYILLKEDGKEIQGIGDLDNCIIEQYTGLKDKNGVEIYEGDKVEIENTLNMATRRHNYNAIVKYKEGSIVTAWDEIWDDESTREVYNDFSSYNTPIVTFEVIGNIHEVQDEN